MANRHISADAAKSQLASFDLKPIQSKKRVQKAAREKGPEFCVYFIEANDIGLIKIGRTQKVANRMQGIAFETGMKPDDLRTLGMIVVGSRDETVALERALHKAFKDCRVDGEWFDIRHRNLQHEAIDVASKTIGTAFSVRGLAYETQKQPDGVNWLPSKHEAKNAIQGNRRVARTRY